MKSGWKWLIIKHFSEISPTTSGNSVDDMRPSTTYLIQWLVANTVGGVVVRKSNWKITVDPTVFGCSEYREWEKKPTVLDCFPDAISCVNYKWGGEKIKRQGGHVGVKVGMWASRGACGRQGGLVGGPFLPGCTKYGNSNYGPKNSEESISLKQFPSENV